MDLLSQRLRPIGPPHAARAIGRFLERERAPLAAMGGGAAAPLGEDVCCQLEAMRAALLRGERPAGKGGAARKSGAREASAGEVGGGNGGSGQRGEEGGAAAAEGGGGGEHKQKKRRER